MSAKLGYLRTFASQQAVGMAAQVAAALPLLLITLLLTRTQGLERAGQFTIVAGLSAFLFSPAAWGFRTHVVLHRFAHFTASDYLAARTAAVSLASAATLVSAAFIHVPLLLGAVVVLFRAGDTLLDLKSLHAVSHRQARPVAGSRWAGAGPASSLWRPDRCGCGRDRVCRSGAAADPAYAPGTAPARDARRRS